MSDVTPILSRIESGDPQAAAHLLLLVYASFGNSLPAGQTNLSADLRGEDISPVAAGNVTIRIAASANEAIHQAIEFQ